MLTTLNAGEATRVGEEAVRLDAGAKPVAMTGAPKIGDAPAIAAAGIKSVAAGAMKAGGPVVSTAAPMTLPSAGALKTGTAGVNAEATAQMILGEPIAGEPKASGDTADNSRCSIAWQRVIMGEADGDAAAGKSPIAGERPDRCRRASNVAVKLVIVVNAGVAISVGDAGASEAATAQINDGAPRTGDAGAREAATAQINEGAPSDRRRR